MADNPLSARELILTLIDSTSASSLSASYFITAGEIFAMDSGGIRVALARLVRDSSLVQAGRGSYALGSRAGKLHSLVQNWSHVEASLKVWSGGWLSVFIGHLARSNKTQVRRSERSLQLHGFAEAQPGLWLRPDNLKAPLTTVFESLTALGLASDSIAAEISRLEPPDSINPAQLWRRATLEQCYHAHIETLTTSGERLAALEHRQAAGETLLIGRRVTRDILLDPLLPDELVDTTLRRAMIQAMKEYDKVGKSLWRQFFLEHESRAQKPAA